MAVELLADEGREALPVLADDSRALDGWVDHRDVLCAYARELNAR